MPRATTEKRATKKASTNARAKTVGAKAVAKKAVKKPVRKAPPRVAVPTVASKRASPKTAALLVALLAIGGATIAIGTSDNGEINVASTIEQKASALEARGDIKESEAVKNVTAPTTKNNGLPNGGLVGRGNKKTEQQKLERKKMPLPSPIEFATSSDEIASSTNPLDDAETDQDVAPDEELDSESDSVDQNASDVSETEILEEAVVTAEDTQDLE
jgi:hypothetical protein